LFVRELHRCEIGIHPCRKQTNTSHKEKNNNNGIKGAPSNDISSGKKVEMMYVKEKFTASGDDSVPHVHLEHNSVVLTRTRVTAAAREHAGRKNRFIEVTGPQTTVA
jgi:uncharacterized membrane protein